LYESTALRLLARLERASMLWPSRQSALAAGAYLQSQAQAAARLK
jgi:hypothetical protein